MLREISQEESVGHCRSEAQRADAHTLSDICIALADLQNKRRFCIGQQSRNNNALMSQARWQLGFRTDLPEKDREAIRKKAVTIVSAIKSGKEIPHGYEAVATELAPYVAMTSAGLSPYDDHRLAVEKQMRKLAKELPAYEFAKEIRGFGDLALAIIVGEAGDLANYPTVSKLWKRLGWAPKEEYPQGEKSKGYKVPRRVKGELYGVVIEPLMKLNDGKYKALYDHRKAEYFARYTAEGGKSPKLHAHRIAMRVMLKELLKDLWAEWNEPLED